MNEREELLALRERQELEQLRALEAQGGGVNEFLGNLPGAQSAPVRQASQFASGAIEGVAGLLGLPFDLSRGAASLLPFDRVDRAISNVMPQSVNNAVNSIANFGGAQIRSGLLDAGITMPEPADATGRVLRRVGQDVGASAMPAGLALNAARTAAPVVNAIGRGAAPTPLLRQLVETARATPGKFMAADVASSMGSGTGAGIAREIYPDSTVAELTGQMLGAAAPAGLAGSARGIFRGGPTNRQALQESVETFGRVGASPSVGQGTGSVSRQGLETVIGKAPGGVSVMRNVARETAERLKQAADDVAGQIGPKVSSEQAGRTIQRGVTEGFVPRFQGKAEQLYGELDNFIPPGLPVNVVNIRNTLTNLTKPIAGAENISSQLVNPKVAQISKALMADIGATGVLPYQALKELRSQVGRSIASPDLVSDIPRAQLKMVYGALSEDMKAAAEAAGPQAMHAFNRANNYYRAAIKRADYLEPIIKKANPEDVFRAATRGSEGASTIRTVRRSLKPSEWDEVSSLVLRRMGRARAGAQDDLGEVFSVETYLTNWNRLAPEARNALFGGTRYAGMDRDLKALAKVASTIRQSSSVLANPSGTAGQVANYGALAAAGGALAAGDVTIPISIAALSGVTAGTAKLATNPTFVKWLAKSTEIPAERLPGYIARLGVTMQNESDDVKDALSEYLSVFGDR